MAFVIGIDTSTTATKAVVIDEAGVVVASGSSGYGFEVPRPRWSEQDPRLAQQNQARYRMGSKSGEQTGE